MSAPNYPALTHIDIQALIAAAGGDPWQVDASVRVGKPKEINDLAEAFRGARGFIVSSDGEFAAARQRFEQSWNHLNGGHPINDSAEVTRAVTTLNLQSGQLDQIALNLELVAAKLAETQKSTDHAIAVLNFKLGLADAKIGAALRDNDHDEVEKWTDAAVGETAAVLTEVTATRDGYATTLSAAMSTVKANGYDAGVLDAVDGDAPAPAPTGAPGTAVSPPPGAAPVTAPSLQDLLTGGPAASPPPGPPGFLDQWKDTLTRGPAAPGATANPLAAGVVAGNPAAIPQQQARVDAARQRLADAQAKVDAAANTMYTQGPGFDGPSRDDIDALNQAVYDARRDLSRETQFLTDLNQANVDLGGRAVPIPALPENIDIQAPPPKPSQWAEASRALNEGSLGFIPDVAKDVDVFTNWGKHSGTEQAGAVLDAIGLIPGAGKVVDKVGDLGLGAFQALRHADDLPGGTVPDLPTDIPGGHHGTPDVPSVPHHSEISYPPEAPQFADDLNRAFVDGAPTADLVRQVADLSTHRVGNADRVVLGKWDGYDGGYIGEARSNGGIYYDTGPQSWDNLTAGLSKDQSTNLGWQVNEQFLRSQLENGVPRIEYVLDSQYSSLEDVVIKRQGSYSAMEIEFLTENAERYGYRRVGNTWVKG